MSCDQLQCHVCEPKFPSVSLFLTPFRSIAQRFTDKCKFRLLKFLNILTYWKFTKMLCFDHWQCMWSETFICFALSLTISEISTFYIKMAKYALDKIVRSPPRLRPPQAITISQMPADCGLKSRALLPSFCIFNYHVYIYK